MKALVPVPQRLPAASGAVPPRLPAASGAVPPRLPAVSDDAVRDFHVTWTCGGRAIAWATVPARSIEEACAMTRGVFAGPPEPALMPWHWRAFAVAAGLAIAGIILAIIPPH